MLWLFYRLELVALFLYNILKIVSNSYLEWVLTLVNALTFYSHLFTAETVQNPIEVEKNIDFFLIHCSENFHPISVAFQADHIQWNDEISIKMCVVLRWKFNRIAIDRQLYRLKRLPLTSNRHIFRELDGFHEIELFVSVSLEIEKRDGK